MTESEWLACNEPERMLDFLRGRASDRSLRRFACACLRRVEGLIPPARRKRLTTLERWVDGDAATEDLEAAVGEVLTGWEPEREIRVVLRENVADALLAFLNQRHDSVELARVVSMRTQYAALAGGKAIESERAAQALLLRDIVKYPQRS